MELIWLEGKRIAKKGWVLLCFLAFLALGLWISELTLERSFRDENCSVEQYLEAAESCRGMALTEAAEYLRERVDAAFQAVETYQDYRARMISLEEAAEKLASLGYGETLPDELTFSELREEWEKYQRVLDEVNLLLQYGDRMREIQQGAGGLSGISFFNEDEYVTLTREKAMRDYAGLQVELDTWQPNVSAREFLQNRVMDGLIFLFLTVVVLLLCMEEKEKGYAALTAAAKGGRQRFYVKKAGVLFAFTLFTVLIYEGALLSYDVWRLGSVVWNAPIQSIAAFEMCCHGFSVGMVIVLTILLKVLLFYVLALVLSALACLMPKTMHFLCVTALIVLLSVVWNRTADINGSFGWMTCLNPIGLTDTAGMIIRYRQFSIFGNPVSEAWISGIFIVLLAPASFAAGLLFYARTAKRKGMLFLIANEGSGKIRKYRQERIDRYAEAVQTGHGRRLPKGAFLLELKKSMISYRMLLPVLVVIFACVLGYFVSDGKPMTQQERFYQEYMTELNGPLTPEKEQFIIEERERYRKLEVFLNELLAQGGDQNLLISYIETELVRKAAFDLVELQYARVQEKGGVFLYEAGYLYLMGLEENESGHIGVFLGVLILILLLPYLSWIELGGGADGVVRTTMRGRSRVLLTQYAVYFLTAVLLFGSLCAEDAAKIFRQFGGYGLAEATENISQLGGFLSGCSIGAYLAVVYALRLLGVALAALLVMACMYLCRDYLSTVLLCGVFLVIPNLLFMNGFSFMRGYFMNALLQGEEFLTLFRNGEVGIILLILLQVGLCVGASYWILRKEVKRR